MNLFAVVEPCGSSSPRGEKNTSWDFSLTPNSQTGVSGHLSWSPEIPVCRCLNYSIVLFAITISVLSEPFVDHPSGLNSYYRQKLYIHNTGYCCLFIYSLIPFFSGILSVDFQAIYLALPRAIYTSPSPTPPKEEKKIQGMAKLKVRFFHYFQVRPQPSYFLVCLCPDFAMRMFLSFTALQTACLVQLLSRDCRGCWRAWVTLFAVVRGSQGQDDIITLRQMCVCVRVHMSSRNFLFSTWLVKQKYVKYFYWSSNGLTYNIQKMNSNNGKQSCGVQKMQFLFHLSINWLCPLLCLCLPHCNTGTLLDTRSVYHPEMLAAMSCGNKLYVSQQPDSQMSQKVTFTHWTEPLTSEIFYPLFLSKKLFSQHICSHLALSIHIK